MTTTARAALFDLDGTLIDNMRFHAQVWVEMSRRLGLDYPQAFFETETAGKKNVEILAMLLGSSATAADVARLGAEKEALYRQRYRPHLKPVPGAVQLLERLSARGIPMAIATLAPRENRELALEGLGLSRFFQQVIGAEQTPRGKPHPDIYLAAAASLGVPPADCVAFEDAVNGVQSAVAAGIPTAAVTTASPGEALRQAGASWILPDYRELPRDLEERLFSPPRAP
ncbi:MAG: HAD family phosphatase [Deltaproteobacteria bacterium]|nr:HAD family phosphatase [Deltaproteobacteria bacterium]